MGGSTFGTVFRVTTWGESHGRAVGAVVDGCPAGLELTEMDVQRELDRRRPGQSAATTERHETDMVEILSGVFEGFTTGTPISMLVWNRDARSSHYDAIRHTPRPGHADYTYHAKYGIRDHRGGGRASARETVGRVAAGAVAKKLLSEFGVEIFGYVIELGGIRASLPRWISTGSIDREELLSLKDRAESSLIRCPDTDASARMLSLLESVRSEGDSIGGMVEVVAIGVLPGLGEPVFDKLDADLAKALMSIGAVKAVEIGAGFESARLRGSEMNDPIFYENGRISFERNNAGGILGGISTGAPVICRISVKPTPSVARSQRTVDLQSGESVDISVRGRHDPAIPPRIVPVAEAMVALVLADHLLRQKSARLR